MLQRNWNLSSNKVESFGASHLMNTLKKLTNLEQKSHKHFCNGVESFKSFIDDNTYKKSTINAKTFKHQQWNQKKTNNASKALEFHVWWTSIDLNQKSYKCLFNGVKSFMSRSQVPRRPTWGSKYVAMRKELELGARSRLPALEGVRGVC